MPKETSLWSERTLILSIPAFEQNLAMAGGRSSSDTF